MSSDGNLDPHCPICDAVDWYSEPRLEYGLLVMVSGGVRGGALRSREGFPQFLPLHAFICRSCRFARLQLARGTLVPPE
jgi:hypothetical protein